MCSNLRDGAVFGRQWPTLQGTDPYPTKRERKIIDSKLGICDRSQEGMFFVVYFVVMWIGIMGNLPETDEAPETEGLEDEFPFWEGLVVGAYV